MSATSPQLVSQSTAGIIGNNDSPPTSAAEPDFGPKISDTGRYIVFDSAATNLDPIYTASSDEVYIRDAVSNTTKMVSVDPFGQPLPNSYLADVTGDGRYVLFFSTNNANNTLLYRRDTVSNSTIVVSVGYNEFTRSPISIGVSADPVTHQPSFPAAISSDGNRVAFATPNRFVVTTYNDTNGTDDIFVRDLTTQSNQLVSTNIRNQAPVSGERVYSLSMNAAGTVVAYDAGVDVQSAGIRRRVYVHNVNLDTTTDVSAGLSTTGSTNSTTAFQSTNSVVSKDGSTVAFLSDDPALSGAASGSTTIISPQVILAKVDRTSNSVIDVRVASRALFGGPSAGNGLQTPSLSADGNYVAFWDDGSDLVTNPTTGTNVYRYDYNNDSVALVSLNSTSTGTTGIDPRLGISDDGRYVVWGTDSTGSDLTITSYGGAGQRNVYVRDMSSFSVGLLNTSVTDPTSAADAAAFDPAISADGTFVTFDSPASNLVSNDTNGKSDVFICPTPVFPPAFLNPLLSAPDVSFGGATSYYFTVTYNSSLPINISTIGDGDVTVTYPPLGFTAVARLLPGSVNLSGDGAPVSATYYITPPGGFWDASDNTPPPNGITTPPRYVIHLNAGEITDVQGDPFPGQDLGSFKVDIALANNDGQASTASVSETAGTETVYFTRNDSLPGNITVNYATVRGTATPGSDYTDVTGTLTFAPGETKGITVPILDDSVIEGDETFRVVLSGATSGALFTYQQVIVTILDNESPTGSGTVSVSPSSPVQPVNGVAGTTISIDNGVTTVTAPETIVSSYGAEKLPITISRADTGTVGLPATFNYTVFSTPSDTATSDNFVQASGTLSFAANESTKDLVVQLLHDGKVTGDRTFTVVLTNATNGLVIGGATIHVVVKDVDSAVQFASASLSTNDDAGVIDVPVTRIGNITPGSKVRLTFGGTAIAGQDYTVVADGTVDEFGDITFAPGETTKTVHLQLIGQPLNLGASRTINLGLTNPRALATSDPFAYDTVLGSPSAETVDVANLDATAPQVSAINFKPDHGRITAVNVTFNEAVFHAKKLSNYALFALTADGKLGPLVPLAKARYDRTTHTATLIPAQPLALNQMYQVNVNGAATLTDVAGNKLDGDANGTPRGSFNGIFGYGRALSYADQDNDLVSFSIKGRGNIRITSLNNAVTVNVLNTEADQTTLIGSVTKRNGGNGKTDLELLRLRGATFDANSSKFSGVIRADIKRKHK